mgnify:CR=1 FL=1
MRGFCSAGWAGNEIAGPNGMALRTDSDFTTALQNKKQFFVDPVAMEWKGPLSGRYNRNVVPEFGCPDARAYGPDPGLETLTVSPGMIFELIDVDDWFAHWLFLCLVVPRYRALVSVPVAG